MTAPRLRIDGLGVSYGGLAAVSDVSFHIGEGELVGLIGPNGAGKTTTVDAISGFTDHRGSVVIGDVDVSRAPAHMRARQGLARTWQSIELFDDLTVGQNCVVAAHRTGWTDLVRDVVRPGRWRDDDATESALAAMDLLPLAGALPTALSHGQRKLVGLARALAAQPSVLLLDEPAAGLDTVESRDLGRRLRGLVDTGMSVLLIDHDTQLVLDVCDRVHVLDFGSVIASGTPAEVRNSERVVGAYLGVGANRGGPGQ